MLFAGDSLGASALEAARLHYDGVGASHVVAARSFVHALQRDDDDVF